MKRINDNDMTEYKRVNPINVALISYVVVLMISIVLAAIMEAIK